MARWKLTEASYFKTVPPVEWEYKEIDENTGRLTRFVLEVPMYMEVGTNVCHQGKGEPRDTVFVGPPTQSMTPLDEEAEAITGKLRPTWDHPIESLPTQGQSPLSAETIQMMDSFAKIVGEAVKPPQPQAISREEFDALREQLVAITKRNAELEKAATRRP